eukprot:m.264468 g.264468  ORF g.264468 m.264468 type:complete len:427 (-) comp17623_c0_seq2:4730-6010(-)
MAECGTAEGDGGASTLPPTPSKKRIDFTKCKKCPDGRPQVLLRLRDAYCKECFFYGVHRKTRSDIGKHRILQQHEKVLLAFSGGNRSSALLGIIHKFEHADEHRQMRIVPTVFHMDDLLAHDFDTSEEDHAHRQERIQALASQLGYDTVEYSRLESVYGEGKAAQDALKTTLQGCKSLTAQQDVIRLLKRQLLIATAKRLGCTKIMVANCNDHLAMQILTDVSSGRGGNMTNVSAFVEHLDGVAILRPLRQITSRETGLYNHFKGIHPYVPKIRGSHAPEKASFERLIQTFVADLLSQYPSTATAVFRTSEKMEMTDADTMVACVLCNGPVEAMRTSRAQITSQGGIKDVRGLFFTQPGQLHTSKEGLEDSIDITNMLCHGCRSTVMDMKPNTLHLATDPSEEVVARQSSARHELSSVLQECQLDS